MLLLMRSILKTLNIASVFLPHFHLLKENTVTNTTCLFLGLLTENEQKIIQALDESHFQVFIVLIYRLYSVVESVR